MTPKQVDDFYREALIRYERIVLQVHLNTIAATISEELPDGVRAEKIMKHLQTDWEETIDDAD